MRFTFVSVALLALGVHGAPAVVSDHTNSLAVRQDPGAVITTLLDSLTDIVQTIMGSATSIPQVAGKVEQIAQKLQKIAAGGVVPRAPSSNSTSSTSSTSFTTLSSTTFSQVSPAATVQRGASTSGVSLGTPQASATPPTRMRRQLPPALPTAALPDVLSMVGSKSASLPVQSVAASALSAALSILGSVTSPSAASKPTHSNPSVSTSQV